jgi:putative Ca2+/H+ antiporter (TMEM165/GDT1 family)
MLNAVVVGFVVVFLAELGDKSQLMAMTFAIRHRWWVVLAGITVATALIQASSVVIGATVGAAIPSHVLAVVAGLTMLAFAFWTWRGEGPDDEEETDGATGARSNLAVFLAVTSSFVLAELGDRTMLATITLATGHSPIGIWIGSTVGMVAAGALAIVVGALLGHRIPERAVHVVATVLFFGFAMWMLVEAIAGLTGTVAVCIVVGLITAVTVVGLLTVWRAHRTRGTVESADPALSGTSPR